MIPPFSLLPSIPRPTSARLVRVQSPCWSCGDVKVKNVQKASADWGMPWRCDPCDVTWWQLGERT